MSAEQSSSPDRAPGVTAPYCTVDVRDAVLVNRQYHGLRDLLVKLIPEPKVRDAVDFMKSQSNRAFFLHDYRGEGNPPYLKPEYIEWEGFGDNPLVHESGHLVPWISHTPQQELFGLAFHTAVDWGIGLRALSDDERGVFQKSLASYIEGYKKSGGTAQTIPVDDVSKRTFAVNFAAGLFWRERVEHFRRYGQQLPTYAEQAQFCKQQVSEDHAPLETSCKSLCKRVHKMRGSGYVHHNLNDILDAPYALMQLSPKEWRAIEAVALGLVDPETEKDAQKNPYPQRMTAVTQALVHMGLLYDMKPEFERAKNNHEANMKEYAMFADLTDKPHLKPTRPIAAEPFSFEKQQAARKEKQRYRLQDGAERF